MSAPICFELAQEFNPLLRENQLSAAAKKHTVSVLVAVYADILKAGLTILGIAAPERL